MAEKPSEPVRSPVDVAVVGAGVSGAYVAWRLFGCDSSQSPVLPPAAGRKKGRPQVALFESSRRVGGRLLSYRLPSAPHLPVELGGMRFLNTQRRVYGLIKHLGLPVKPFPVADPRQTNLYYLRGERFTDADWARPGFRPPYRLRPEEGGKSPGALLIAVARKYLPEAAFLYNRGFWNLLLHELSPEAYRLVMDAGGYYTLVNNWNAARAVPYLLADFGPVDYLALCDGFQSLPLTLVDQFKTAEGQVLLRHRLHHLKLVKRRGETLIQLTFDTDEPSPFPPHRAGAPATYLARHVVLAMPRRAIELLHPDSFLFESKPFQSDLRTVLAQPALKLFSSYAEPWWEPLNVKCGRSVTDLPLRQCYYWGTEGEQEGADPTDRHSILMASYNDGSAVEFWSGLARHQKVYRPAVERGGAERRVRGAFKVRQQLQAPEVMVQEMQRQLADLHGLVAPDPVETVYHDWTLDPYGGGWHFWKIHMQAEEVMPRIQHPISGVNLYICGEAWSTHQGWVEGALETADSILYRNFGVPAPAWMQGHAAKA